METQTALYTIADLCDRWQVTRQTVSARIRSGELPAIKVGRNVRIDPVDVERYELKSKAEQKLLRLVAESDYSENLAVVDAMLDAMNAIKSAESK